MEGQGVYSVYGTSNMGRGVFNLILILMEMPVVRQLTLFALNFKLKPFFEFPVILLQLLSQMPLAQM